MIWLNKVMPMSSNYFCHTIQRPPQWFRVVFFVFLFSDVVGISTSFLGNGFMSGSVVQDFCMLDGCLFSDRPSWKFSGSTKQHLSSSIHNLGVLGATDSILGAMPYALGYHGSCMFGHPRISACLPHEPNMHRVNESFGTVAKNKTASSPVRAKVMSSSPIRPTSEIERVLHSCWKVACWFLELVSTALAAKGCHHRGTRAQACGSRSTCSQTFESHQKEQT
jgi:hypothetical protein